ncbi:MAG: protoheme IX farnesyltransferase [Chthonomonadales bacterium]|nr:protoheme IX farnesyltransferase [Chthonomonadales bacterium]
MHRTRFPHYAWGLLLYNVGVIAWGAYVRATGSGAGCGNHWPTCDGQVFPRPRSAEMLVELSHRLSSGLVLLGVLALVAWAMRAYPAGHRVRRVALLALLFTLTEALLGAVLVKYGLVVGNQSAARAVAMSAHLLNTFALLAGLTLTAWYASGGAPIRLRGQGAIGWGLMLALVGVALLGVSGAVTALGDTLFPASSLQQALAQDISPTAHFLLRLRFFHPLIAVSVGVYVLLIAGLATYLRPGGRVRRTAHVVGALFVLQVALGFANMLLLAPVWMQLAHLVVADAVWIALLILTATALGDGVPRTHLGGASLAGSSAPSPHSGRGSPTWRDYVALTKPRVISLLLFTTLATMFIAEGGWPGGWLLLAVSVGGYLAAGSANAINMVIDRDIDGRMRRTAERPTVTARISSRRALLFALALEAGSLVLLTAGANLLTALLALAGLAYYVIIYTLMLKRRTWHNIVIGGAAGAFPPLVGWAAVTGQLSVLSWYLFAIIFVWTPVHFWALALLIKDDYADAGVPMLPVVLGERVTVAQIALYAVLTTIISVLPFAQGEVGWIYLCASVLLNGALLARSASLYRTPDRPRAASLFKYSMVYLALLFLMMAVDRASWIAPLGRG